MNSPMNSRMHSAAAPAITYTVTYTILDPTGNITALVESDVPVARQPSVAASIMCRHPEVEQVGFVSVCGDAAGAGRGVAAVNDAAAANGVAPLLPSLRMAGGEFCGNASMCAAVLCAERSGGDDAGAGAETDAGIDAYAGAETSIRLRVSGAAEPVTVRLREVGDAIGAPGGDAAGEPAGGPAGHLAGDPAGNLTSGPAGNLTGGPAGPLYEAGVTMPPALAVGRRIFSYAGVTGELPLVQMQGISHILIDASSPFAPLLSSPEAAQQAVRAWCSELAAEGLGLMFLGPSTAPRTLTPLVYIPGSDTLFWEKSCASGTSAAGMFLAAAAGRAVDLFFREPGGSLRVISDPATGLTTLCGTVRICRSYSEQLAAE